MEDLLRDAAVVRGAILGMLKRMETLDEITSGTIGVKVLIESSHFCSSAPLGGARREEGQTKSQRGSCQKNGVNSIFQQLFSIECRKISTTDFASVSLRIVMGLYYLPAKRRQI